MNAVKTILLITNGFPYDDREVSFLGEEFLNLCRNHRIIVLALGRYTHSTLSEKYSTKGIAYYTVSASGIHLNALLRSIFNLRTIEEVICVFNGDHSLLLLRRLAAVLLYAYRSEIYLSKVKKIYANDRFDFIYTFWSTPATLAALKFKQIADIKYITRFHGGDLYLERVRRFGYYFPFRQKIVDSSSMLLFLSEKAKEYFTDHWRVSDEKCSVVPLGTRDFDSLPLYEPSDNSISIVTVANSIELKRIDLIIDSIALVEKSYNVIWNYIGTGDKWDELKQYAESKLSKPNVSWKFWGFVKNEELVDVYRSVKASLFMLLSSTEGVPVSIEEALGLGIPVIATDVGSVCEEVIDGVTGFLLDANPTPNDVAAAIEKYIGLTSMEKKRMKDDAHRLWYEKYSARKNADRVLHAFES